MKNSNFFILKHIVDDKFQYIEKSQYPEQLGEYTLRCKEIDFDYEITLYNEDEKSLRSDFVAGIHSLPILSTKFKGVVEKIEENIRFKQIRMILKDELIDNSYWHTHILNYIDVFDWENSEYIIETWDEKKGDIATWLPSQLNSIPTSQLPSKVLGEIKKIQLVEERIPKGCHIFRVKSLETNIFVSKTFKDKVMEAGITGVEFIPLV